MTYFFLSFNQYKLTIRQVPVHCQSLLCVHNRGHKRFNDGDVEVMWLWCRSFSAFDFCQVYTCFH